MKENKINIPIQLVSVCSTLGNITPKWFRYEEQEHQIIKVEISEVVTQNDINFVGIKMIQYICKAKIYDKERLFELRYDINSHRWTFHQMLN